MGESFFTSVTFYLRIWPLKEHPQILRTRKTIVPTVHWPTNTTTHFRLQEKHNVWSRACYFNNTFWKLPNHEREIVGHCTEIIKQPLFATASRNKTCDEKECERKSTTGWINLRIPSQKHDRHIITDIHSTKYEIKLSTKENTITCFLLWQEHKQYAPLCAIMGRRTSFRKVSLI